MKFNKIATVTALAASLTSAAAFPIASVGTEGIPIIASGPNTFSVVATYEGNSAGYSNDLYLERDAFGNPGMDGITANDLFLFNNHASPVGSTAVVGQFNGGTELIFRLHVNNTGDNFFSGLASRNTDNLPHARAQGNWTPGTTLVSFEDLINTPEGANGYNDLSFSFTNTETTNPVPEASTTMAMALTVGVAGISAIRRKLKR